MTKRTQMHWLKSNKYSDYTPLDWKFICRKIFEDGRWVKLISTRYDRKDSNPVWIEKHVAGIAAIRKPSTNPSEMYSSFYIDWMNDTRNIYMGDEAAELTKEEFTKYVEKDFESAKRLILKVLPTLRRNMNFERQ